MPYYHELLLFHTGGELTCTIARPNPPPHFPPSLVPIFFPTPPYLPQPMQPSLLFIIYLHVVSTFMRLLKILRSSALEMVQPIAVDRV